MAKVILKLSWGLIVHIIMLLKCILSGVALSTRAVLNKVFMQVIENVRQTYTAEDQHLGSIFGW